MNAAACKDRLRADLKTAMLGRERERAALLRTLIAALDNAEAVPLAADAKPADSADFASGRAEAARRGLTAADVAAVLQGEVASRLAAAARIRAGGNQGEAARLEVEAAVVRGYLP